MDVKIGDQKNGAINVNVTDHNPLVFVVSRQTKNWGKTVGTISANKNILNIKQYQIGNRDYPMLGINDENPLISKELSETAEAINLIFSRIKNLESLKKIILVIHDQELFERGGEYPTSNEQKLEKKETATYLKKCSGNIEIEKDSPDERKNKYFICKTFEDCKINAELEVELWSFMHDSSDIDNKALNFKKNVYDELIKALTPNFKKKLVDIKFRTLQLFLPLHIDFMGLSTCDATKRNEYWDKIKNKFFSTGQYKETLNEVCSLINGNGSDNVESISSFAADAGFDDDTNWTELKILIGKDSKANGFFELVSKNNLSDILNSLKNFKFSSDENGHMREITGCADWYASIVEHFDALIAACK